MSSIVDDYLNEKMKKQQQDPDREPKGEYKFNEKEYVEELLRVIDSTYTGHYSRQHFQATEFIIDGGHGTGFCIGNILKYSQRYGKKDGKNRNDLLKVIHYGIMALHNHDTQEKN